MVKKRICPICYTNMNLAEYICPVCEYDEVEIVTLRDSYRVCAECGENIDTLTNKCKECGTEDHFEDYDTTITPITLIDEDEGEKEDYE